MSEILKPIKRSNIRLKLGRFYYGMLRIILWVRMYRMFASDYQQESLPYLYFSHRTVLLRKLKDVDMWLQHNKIINLRIATKKLNGILIRPGEVLSYWKLIGKPSKRKGYVDGMILKNGTFSPGIGGGLCQLSNLIFWMTIHTPLTVIERHRHGYDVFPDSNRTLPFGSGATCFYPHGDLMIRNDTEDTYQ
ncbi:MAG: VanW family protein, partial [Clostridiales bacterium]|nr:VanW family protein [Clostridiales bacterium]